MAGKTPHGARPNREVVEEIRVTRSHMEGQVMKAKKAKKAVKKKAAKKKKK